MVEKMIYICETCAKRCDDRHEQIGWIRADGEITVFKGRAKDGQGITDWHSDSSRDFCSIVCLAKFLGYRIKP